MDVFPSFPKRGRPKGDCEKITLSLPAPLVKELRARYRGRMGAVIAEALIFRAEYGREAAASQAIVYCAKCNTEPRPRWRFGLAQACPTCKGKILVVE